MLSKNKNYIILDTRKDGIRFQNEKLRKLNDKFVTIRDTYLQEQKTAVDEVIEVASMNHSLFILD